MGKRQIRIFQRDIPNKISLILNKEANIVFSNKTTIHGTVVKIESTIFTIKDFKRVNHKVNLSDIVEINFDQVALY